MITRNQSINEVTRNQFIGNSRVGNAIKIRHGNFTRYDHFTHLSPTFKKKLMVHVSNKKINDDIGLFKLIYLRVSTHITPRFFF